MSITRKRTMTEKSLAAHRENARKSQGPVTPEGKERARDASLRHGFYSRGRDTALRALGEKPEEFNAVVKAVMNKWDPADGFEELLSMRLARVMWRVDRADRMQEGYALRQAKEVNDGREDRLHAHLMRLKMTEGSLQKLSQAVRREHYVTAPRDLETMKSLCQEGEVKEMGEIALALFLQLREPGEHDAEGRHIDPQEMSRRAVMRIKEIFGLSGDTPPAVGGAADSRPPQGSPPVRPQESAGVPRTPETGDAGAPEEEHDARYPDITPAEWEAREPVRQLLENILTRQVETCKAQRKATLKESLAGPSPYERAAEIAPIHPHAALMQRMEDSNFRQAWRITNMLIKLKRQAREQDSWEQETCENSPESGNLPDPPSRRVPDPESGNVPDPISGNVPDAESGDVPDKVAPIFKACPERGEGSPPADVAPGFRSAPFATPPPADAAPTRACPDMLGRSAFLAIPRSADVAPGFSPARADLKVGVTTNRQTPWQEACENTPESGNVYDNTPVSGFHPDPSKNQAVEIKQVNQPELAVGRQNKKDTKMKVHPDESFRINTTGNKVGAARGRSGSGGGVPPSASRHAGSAHGHASKHLLRSPRATQRIAITRKLRRADDAPGRKCPAQAKKGRFQPAPDVGFGKYDYLCCMHQFDVAPGFSPARADLPTMWGQAPVGATGKQRHTHVAAQPECMWVKSRCSATRRSRNPTWPVGAGLVPALRQGTHQGRPYKRRKMFAKKNKNLRYCHAGLYCRSAALSLWARTRRGPIKQVRATLPRPASWLIMGGRKAVKAQGDSATQRARAGFDHGQDGGATSPRVTHYPASVSGSAR